MSGGEIALGMGAVGLFSAFLSHQSGQSAAGAVSDASEAQIAAQREALDYMKQVNAIPQAYKERALTQLGRLYGLGDPIRETAKVEDYIQNTIPKASKGLFDAVSGTNKSQAISQAEQGMTPEQSIQSYIDKYGIGPGTKKYFEDIKGYSGTATETPMAATETPIAATETPIAATETPIAATETPIAAANMSDMYPDVVGGNMSDMYPDVVGGNMSDMYPSSEDEISKTGPNANTEPIANLEDEVQEKYPESSAEVQQQLIDQAMASPLYNYLLSGKEAGEESILRNQSAIGKLRSGSSAHALYDYNTQLQNNALMQTYNQQLAGLNQMAGLGTDQQTIAQLLTSIGGTQAAGISGAAQAQMLGTQFGLGGIMDMISGYYAGKKI